MDQKLLAWGRAVKQRRRDSARSALPVLWLFTDHDRVPDPLPHIGLLPRGSGVVFRPEGWSDPARLGREIALLARRRGLVLVVAGDTRLAWQLRAGVHLRGGRRAGVVPLTPGPITSSAHDGVEIRRAMRAGASAIFLSAAFPTRSHPGAFALGTARWRALARHGPRTGTHALGGILGTNVRRLGRSCRGAGAIEAFATPPCGA